MVGTCRVRNVGGLGGEVMNLDSKFLRPLEPLRHDSLVTSTRHPHDIHTDPAVTKYQSTCASQYFVNLSLFGNTIKAPHIESKKRYIGERSLASMPHSSKKPQIRLSGDDGTNARCTLHQHYCAQHQRFLRPIPSHGVGRCLSRACGS
jgi:hypothetical protein